MRSDRVIDREAPTDLDTLVPTLEAIFLEVQSAMAANEPVILIVRTEDLLGHRSPEQGAYANALVGLARAVAFEGVRPGWRINVVAVPSGLSLGPDEAAGLASSEWMSGQLLVLGSGLLGKVAV